MKNILAVILFSIILNPVIINAQVTQEWVVTYNGTGSGFNFPKKNAIDNKGNFIVAGNSDSTGGYDYVILKYSPSGNLIWKQRYNGTGNSYDYLTGMVLDDSGNVYVTGESNEGASLGGINWVTIKYSSDGKMMWNRSLNWTGNNIDEPFGMNIDKENNIYVVGFGRYTNNERALVTIKYSKNGDSVWTTNYRSLPNRSNWGYSVSIDDSLNVYSSGYGALPMGNEIVTIKYDKSGNEKWIRKYPTLDGDYLRPTFSEIDKEKNIIVVGKSYVSNTYDIVTMKYSPGGDLIWSRIYNGGNIDRANSLYLDTFSNILIAGFTVSNNDPDFLIIKYSPAGDTLLLKNITGEGVSYDEAHSIKSDVDGNIYVTGPSHSTSFRADFLTLKLTSLGQIVWSKIYRTPLENFSYSLSLDSSGSVYISGEGELALGFTGIISVKYSQMTGVKSGKFLNLSSFNLKNYPNPFNPVTQIYFNIPVEGNVRITVFNIAGQKVSELINEFKSGGSYKIEFNGSNLSSGIYYYRIESGNYSQVKKMILLK